MCVCHTLVTLLLSGSWLSLFCCLPTSCHVFSCIAFVFPKHWQRLPVLPPNVSTPHGDEAAVGSDLGPGLGSDHCTVIRTAMRELTPSRECCCSVLSATQRCCVYLCTGSPQPNRVVCAARLVTVTVTVTVTAAPGQGTHG